MIIKITKMMKLIKKKKDYSSEKGTEVNLK